MDIASVALVVVGALVSAPIWHAGVRHRTRALVAGGDEYRAPATRASETQGGVGRWLGEIVRLLGGMGRRVALVERALRAAE